MLSIDTGASPDAGPGVRVFAVTGEDVAGFELGQADAEPLLRGVGARSVAVDPLDPDRVYVGTFDQGVFASRDGGRSWRQDERGLEDRRVMSVAVSPSHRESGVSVVYAGTEPSNLHRSEVGGRSFARLPALRELPSEPRWSFPPRPWTHHVSTIALHPTDPDRLTVGIELGGVMRSFDGGASWIDHNRQAHSDAHRLLTHPLAPDRLYEVAGQGIARSDDRGENWTRYEDGLDRHYGWAQALDPADPTCGTCRSAALRVPRTADAMARLTFGARAATDGWRSTRGETPRSFGGCRTRWPRLPANPAGCSSACAEERCCSATIAARAGRSCLPACLT
jgi:hypothetical protein